MSYSQDKITYINGILTLTYANDAGDIISEQNLAKDVVVAYDPFYKSYYIEGNLEDKPFNTQLSYVQTANGVKLYSNQGIVYMVFDNLKDDKGFMFTQKDRHPEGELDKIYFIRGLKRYYPE